MVYLECLGSDQPQISDLKQHNDQKKEKKWQKRIMQ
jgi:hypothetical protein